VANTNSVAAVAASSLWRRHAWVVTGTVRCIGVLGMSVKGARVSFYTEAAAGVIGNVYTP